MGASLWALHALCQLHWSRHWSPCSWAMPWVHQWRKRVSSDWEIKHANQFFKYLLCSLLKAQIAQHMFSNPRCPARECHGAFKCKGVFVDSFAIGTLEECIAKCNDVEDCQWFTLEKANDHCILYEECNDQFDCETCASGEKKCAHGYKG